jgi:hypothetical protein
MEKKIKNQKIAAHSLCNSESLLWLREKTMWRWETLNSKKNAWAK